MTDTTEPSSYTQLEQVTSALAGLCQGFEADDYDFQIVGIQGTTLQVKIDAGPTACAECLVPAPAMSKLILASLPHEIGVTDVSIQYPKKPLGLPE